MLNNREDISNNALTLLSANSTWMLARHQWLVDNMRSILTGDNPPPEDKLYEFDDIVPKSLNLPDNLSRNFSAVKITLEALWKDTIAASHPVSGLTVYEQLDNYQKLAHQFMAFTQEANHELWQECATRDFLTGAWTRLKLQSCLNQALKHANQYDLPCSIALLDQNKFKLINDRWGHVIGDEVLAKTAALIEKNLRPNDKLFRYGGDEWLVLMPSANEALAQTIVQRIANLFESHAFESQTGETFNSTFSFGVAEATNQKTPDEWISTADTQLYSHKAQ